MADRAASAGGQSRAQARITERQAQARAELALAAAALDRGEITLGHFDALANADRGIVTEHLDELVDTARHLPIDRFRRYLARFCDFTAGDAGAERASKLHAQRYARFSHPDVNGLGFLNAGWAPDQWAIVRSAASAITESEWAAAHPDGHARPGTGDDRTWDQRMADSIVEMARRSLSGCSPLAPSPTDPTLSADGIGTTGFGAAATTNVTGTTGNRTAGSGEATGLPRPSGPTSPTSRSSGWGPSRPEMIVIIDYETLVGLLDNDATIVAGGPIPAATARRLACDADIFPVVLGGDSVVLDAGRGARLASNDQRRALMARDGPTCVVPGCPVPADRCRVHHLDQHLHGGHTNLPRLVLVCDRHHHHVHEGGAHLIRQHGHWHLEPRPPPERPAAPRTRATTTGAGGGPETLVGGEARGTVPLSEPRNNERLSQFRRCLRTQCWLGRSPSGNRESGNFRWRL